MKRDANPEKGLEALDQCEYMVLAMTDGEGKPYCIPLNGVRAGEKIYFHCAKAGEKVDCLRTHPQVCLTAVGHQRVIQAIYETEYQCAVVRGTAGEVTDETEMREAPGVEPPGVLSGVVGALRSTLVLPSLIALITAA